MDPNLQGFLDSYFTSFNAGNEAMHKKLWGPHMAYFGSSLRTTVQGLGSLQGVWKAIRDGVGIRRITPVRTFGTPPEFGVLVHFQGEGNEPAVNGAMVFQVDEANLIKRLGVHWDPGSFLKAKEYPGRTIPPRESLQEKDPRVQATLNAYFQTFNAADEAGHSALLHPDLVFFGSLSGVESEGRASALGVFRSARGALGIGRLTAKKYFGDWPELSVLVELAQADGRGAVEVLIVFQFDEEGLIRRLAILWDPLPYLKAIGGV